MCEGRTSFRDLSHLPNNKNKVGVRVWNKKLSGDLVKNGCVVSSLTSSFILHIAYMRGLIPMPFVTIQKEVNSTLSQNVKKLSSTEKKLVVFVNQMISLLNSLETIARCHIIHDVYLLLGPSANNVKESYALHFDGSGVTCDEYRAEISPRAVDRYKRQLLHKLMEHHCNDNSKLLPRTNIFIALNICKSPFRSIPMPTSSSIEDGSVMEEEIVTDKELEEVALMTRAKQALAESYVYKETFKVKERKKGRPQLHVSVTAVGEEQVTASLSTTHIGGAHTATDTHVAKKSSSICNNIAGMQVEEVAEDTSSSCEYEVVPGAFGTTHTADFSDEMADSCGDEVGIKCDKDEELLEDEEVDQEMACEDGVAESPYELMSVEFGSSSGDWVEQTPPPPQQQLSLSSWFVWKKGIKSLKASSSGH